MSSILAVIHPAAIVLRSRPPPLHLFPEVMVARAGRYAHGGQGDGGVTIEQSKETVSPAALGCNLSKQEVEDRQYGEDGVFHGFVPGHSYPVRGENAAIIPPATPALDQHRKRECHFF